MRIGVKIIGLMACALAAAVVVHAGSLRESSFVYPYSPFKDRDIFRPLVNDRGEILLKEKRGVGDFLLQGIVGSGDEITAIINNALYKTGDTFEGYAIMAINATSVIIHKEGQEFVITWEG